jgi:D-alanyl-D-alanine carboxypeptidase/D-alanyl-D-alanine-endopeptidase (penicillin-binding protein 4)
MRSFFFFCVLFLEVSYSYSQYRPSYLKNIKSVHVEKPDSLAAFPGRKKLINLISASDSCDLLKNASWGIMVADANSGKVIAAHNQKMLLIPASLMKSITTGIGYLQMGSDFRFKTKLEYSGTITKDSVLKGDLIIVGGGDPTTCCFRWAQTYPDTIFSQFTAKLKDIGIRKIEGKIVSNKSIFDDLQMAPNWQWNDMGNYYGAGASALAFNENIIHVWLHSPDSLGLLTTLDSVFPVIPNIEYRNFVVSAASNTGDNVVIYSSPNSNIIELRGSIPLGQSSFLVKGANFHPEYSFMLAFNNYLVNHGVITKNEYGEISHRTPTDTNAANKLIYTYYSPSYNTIASFTNKVSHNMFAEAILKTLGYRRFGLGSYYNGVRAVDVALSRQGISHSEMINVDGSGLSRNNLVTPEFICRYMRMMYKSGSYGIFVHSLPEAGESGTIGRMFKGTAAAHNLRAKSGSIERVRSYGGYVTNRNGKLLTFALIINNFNERSSAIRDLMEKLMIAIADSD